MEGMEILSFLSWVRLFVLHGVQRILHFLSLIAYADETDPLSPLEIDPLELIGFLGQKSGSSSGLI